MYAPSCPSNGRTINLVHLLKALAALSFFLLTLGMVDQLSVPLSGYETSVYANLTPLFWFGFIFSFIVGTIIVIYYINTHKSRFLLYAGIGLVVAYFATLISLSLIRNYYLWCMQGDPATHIYYVLYIMENGTYSMKDIYPALHIFGAEARAITGYPIEWISKFIPLLYGLLFIPFTYILSRQFLRSDAALITLVIASTAIGGWYLNFTPNASANLLFPFYLYIYVKCIFEKDRRWHILFLILIPLYPLLHILPSMALVMVMIAIPITYRLFKKIVRIDNINFKYQWIFIILLGTWTLIWASMSLEREISETINSLLNGTSYLKIYTSKSESSSAMGLEGIYYILKVWGVWSFYIVIAFFTFVAFALTRKGYGRTSESRILLLFGPLLGFTAAIGVLYFAYLPFSPFRLLFYITIISIIVFSFLFYRMINNKIKWKKIAGNAISIAIIFMLAIAIMITAYTSPLTFSDNYQSTQSEVNGMGWFYDDVNPTYNITGISVVPGRYALLHYELEEPIAGYPYFIRGNNIMLPHFGYDRSDKIVMRNHNDSYMILMERDRERNDDFLPGITNTQFISLDFVRLYYDPTVNKVYSANGFEISLVYYE